MADSSCPDKPFVITGNGSPGLSGLINGTLSPITDTSKVRFNTANSFSLATTATASTIYTLQVSDENNCVSKPVSDGVYIQLPAKEVRWDTTVIIGEPIPLNAYAGSNFTYTWAPVTTSLSCLNCFNPISTVTANITYTVLIEDRPLGCYITPNIYKIIVDPKTSLDVPTAFTPNGDGTNDVIYADGWGIRKLYYFKIFNRWGQLLFQTNNIKEGWDGRFNGVLQNVETYVYQVSADTYTDETITKSGTFKLIR